MLRSICLLVRGGILRYWHLKIWRELDLSGGLADWRFGSPSLIHGLAVARSSVHHTPFSRRFLQVRTAKHEIHAPITRRRPFFSFSPLDLQLLAIYLCILCWWTLREIVLRIVQSIGSRVYML